MLGTLLNERYRIDSELGSGGMGAVFRGHDLLLDRPVAIKTIQSASLTPESRSRLLHEARAVAHLNHPNIVDVYDVGEAGELPYIIMELIPGQNLRAFGALALSEVLTTMIQICDALAYAHSNGVIHRDLKPENILVVRSGSRLLARLNDFGLALLPGADRLTHEDAVIGSVFYLAPELIQGANPGVQSDLYALGATLFECLAGSPPFPGENLISVLSQHLNAPAVPPSTFNPAVPEALDRLVLQMLEKDPASRPDSAENVRLALESILSGESLPKLPEVTSILPIDRIVRGRLVGRSREWEIARSAWQRAISGEPGVLLISGEPGIGKTRLARELMAQAQVQRASVLLGECFLEGSAPFDPIAQMLRSISCPGDLPPFALASLAGIAPHLDSPTTTLPTTHALDPAAELQRLSDSLLEFCRCLCTTSPTLLVLDDAHWADSGSLTLLRNLARRASRLQLRLLLVFTYREIELEEAHLLNSVLHDLNRERLSIRIKLPRFDREQTQLLLAALFGEEITPELLEGIYQETEGNPFFIEEVCKALIEKGQVYRLGSRWQRPGMDEIEIPQSIRLAVQFRVGRLPGPAQEALQAASVIGREFSCSLLQALCGLEDESLIEAMEKSERAQLIQEVSRESAPGAAISPTFAFTHALIHSTLYESLNALRRQRLHRLAAESILRTSPERSQVLAHHYSRAGMVDEARSCYIAAGERALTALASRDAEKAFRQALELGGPTAQRAAALSGLAAALYHQSRPSEAILFWEQALPLWQELGETDPLARSFSSLVSAARQLDDIDGSLAYGERGRIAVSNTGSGALPSVGLASLLRETAVSYSYRGFHERALDLFQQALFASERSGSVEEQAITLVRFGYEMVINSPAPQAEEGLGMLTRAVEIAEAAGCLQAAELAHTQWSVTARDILADLPTAMEHAARAAQIARQVGMAGRELFSVGLLSSLHTYLGNVSELRTQVERGEYLMKIVETAGPEVYAFKASQAGLAYLSNDWDKTRKILQDAFAEARCNRNSSYAGFIAYYLCMFYVETREWQAIEATLQSLAQLTEKPFGASEYAYLAIACARTTRLPEARQSLASAQEHASQSSGLIIRAALLHAQAELAQAEGRWTEAFMIYESLAGALSQAGLRFFESRLLRHWIEALLARGEPDDHEIASSLLERLAGLYTAMGALELAAHIQDLRNHQDAKSAKLSFFQA